MNKIQAEQVQADGGHKAGRRGRRCGLTKNPSQWPREALPVEISALKKGARGMGRGRAIGTKTLYSRSKETVHPVTQHIE